MSKKPSHPSTRIAELALLVGTVFWGCSFNWVKDGDDAVNCAIGAGNRSAIGPILLAGIRFFLGGIAWLCIFPSSRRGWSKASLLRCIFLGLLLFMGTAFQVLGLLTTTEAVAAFLTSLTVLFVPLLMTIALRRPPEFAAWIGVLLATIGIWLMTAGAPSGFGIGELLGLCASISFAIYILAVDSIVPKDSPSRITAGQFIVCGCISLLTVLITTYARHLPIDLSPTNLAVPSVMTPLLLLIALPTLCAFGLLTRYQPLLDPTRVAILYLAEPIFAAAFAWIAAGRRMGAREIAGAFLILIANLVVEFLSRGNADKIDGPIELKESHGP
jgi:drug/metabolite transporter (DMT)-like permease